jgi:hypothetical protein
MPLNLQHQRDQRDISAFRITLLAIAYVDFINPLIARFPTSDVLLATKKSSETPLYLSGRRTSA